MAQKPEEASSSEDAIQVEPVEDKNLLEEIQPKAEVEAPPFISTTDTGDLLVCYILVSPNLKFDCNFSHLFFSIRLQGLNEINPKALELEDSNAMALAIVPNGKLQLSSSSSFELWCTFTLGIETTTLEFLLL